MNEKFNELSELAQEKLIDPITGEEYYSFSRMKFADLIVKECADVANEHNDQAEGVTLGVGRALKEHFGVEE